MCLVSFVSLPWVRLLFFLFFFSSRRRHTRSKRDWSSDVCSSDLVHPGGAGGEPEVQRRIVRGDAGIETRRRRVGERRGETAALRALIPRATSTLWETSAATFRIVTCTVAPAGTFTISAPPA